jgi:hypothetical protein
MQGSNRTNTHFQHMLFYFIQHSTTLTVLNKIKPDQTQRYYFVSSNITYDSMWRSNNNCNSHCRRWLRSNFQHDKTVLLTTKPKQKFVFKTSFGSTVQQFHTQAKKFRPRQQPPRTPTNYLEYNSTRKLVIRSSLTFLIQQGKFLSEIGETIRYLALLFDIICHSHPTDANKCQKVHRVKK